MSWRVPLLVAAMLSVLVMVGGTALTVAVDGAGGTTGSRGPNARNQLTGRVGDVLLGLGSADTPNGVVGRAI